MESTLNERYKDDNLSWAGKYPIQIHGSIAMKKIKEDNKREMRYKCQTVQYTFEWQKARMVGNVTMYGYKNIL